MRTDPHALALPSSLSASHKDRSISVIDASASSVPRSETLARILHPTGSTSSASPFDYFSTTSSTCNPTESEIMDAGGYGSVNGHNSLITSQDSTDETKLLSPPSYATFAISQKDYEHLLQTLYRYLATSLSPCPRFVDKKALLAACSHPRNPPSSALVCAVLYYIVNKMEAGTPDEEEQEMMASLAEVVPKGEEVKAWLKQQTRVSVARGLLYLFRD